MFSHLGSWELEDLRAWQDEENKSKKQRKFQSSFGPRTWPSLLHIRIMKRRLSVRSPHEEGESQFPQNLEGTWGGNGAWLRVAGISISWLQQEVRAMSTNLFRSSSGTLPVSPKASPCPQTESIWIKEKKNVCHASHVRGSGCQETKQKVVNHWSGQSSWREMSLAPGFKKTLHLAGTRIFLAAHW